MEKKTKFRGKIAFFCVIVMLAAASPAFSQNKELKDLKKTMGDFSGNLAESLPFNATMGLNWSDAYMQNFPHFGAGFSLGFTTMDAGSFNSLLKNFAISLPAELSGFGGFPIPGYTVEGRLGGFVLPFDIGFKFGMMPLPLKGDLTLDYLLFGGDIRYAVFNTKKIPVIPTISLGLGFNHISGGIGQKVGQDIVYDYIDFTNSDTPAAITVKKPEVSVNWSVTTIDMKAQASMSFVFFTPYIGVGASYGESKAGYGVKTTVEDNGGLLNNASASQISKKFDIDNLKENGFSSEVTKGGWSVRTFGGFSVNLALIRLDFTGFWNFEDKYGVTFGTRVQL